MGIDVTRVRQRQKRGNELEVGVSEVLAGGVRRAVLRCSSPRRLRAECSGLAVCEAFDQGRLAAAPHLS